MKNSVIVVFAFRFLLIVFLGFTTNSLAVSDPSSVIASELGTAEATPINPAKQHIFRSFTAEMMTYNRFYPKEVVVSRVFISPGGIRLQQTDMFGDHQQGWFLQSFKESKAWVVRPEKRVYAELPDENETGRSDNQHSENLSARATDQMTNGVMSTQVCAAENLLQKQVIGTELVGGYETVVLACRYTGYSVKQFFSSDLNMVLREEQPGNLILELGKIEELTLQNELYSPPETFDELSLQEFFLNANSLDRFNE